MKIKGKDINSWNVYQFIDWNGFGQVNSIPISGDGFAT